jgi:hypothetical protein
VKERPTVGLSEPDFSIEFDGTGKAVGNGHEGNGSKAQTSRPPSHSLTTLQKALKPYRRGGDMRQVRSIVSRTKDFIEMVAHISASPLASELRARNLIESDDLLASPHLPDIFFGLKNLEELVKRVFPSHDYTKLGKDYTVLRKELHCYVYSCTNKWHDDLLAVIFSCMAAEEVTPAAVKQWRLNHGLKSRQRQQQKQ